jgi:hypothetical protein
MTDTTITCPNCKTEFPLSESLAAPLIAEARRSLEQQLREKEAALGEREAAVERVKEELSRDRQQLDAELASKLAEARTKIAAEEASKAKTAAESDVARQRAEVTALQEQMLEKDRKLEEAQRVQAEALKKARELDQKERELELTLQQRLSAEISTIRAQAKQEAHNAIGLKVKERDETIGRLTRQIEDLNRKAEQGSQQLQGEVLELQLEQLLHSTFALDSLEPVAKGEFGGDVLQRVMTASGVEAGSILWETKRTANWSDAWLAKVKHDQRAAKADLSIIVSQALPKGIETFGLIDGVWVVSTKCVIPVATAMRETLLSVSSARVAGEGQQTKMQLIYDYLTGPQFRHRVEAIIEQLAYLQAGLESERRAMQRIWAKREKQLRIMAAATSGMWGDLQGIAGQSIQEIEALDLDLLGGPEDSSSEEDDYIDEIEER